jgi:hypothetical protein
LRVTKYLVEVRDHLSPQQQRRLMGVCAAGVREGCQGPPWARGGATQPGSRPGKGHMKGRR